MPPKGGSGGNKVALILVVAGAPTPVEANINAPLRAAVNKALEDSGNTGRPPQDWELRTESGELMDLSRTPADYGLNPATTLFLSVRAGALG